MIKFITFLVAVTTLYAEDHSPVSAEDKGPKMADFEAVIIGAKWCGACLKLEGELVKGLKGKMRVAKTDIDKPSFKWTDWGYKASPGTIPRVALRYVKNGKWELTDTKWQYPSTKQVLDEVERRLKKPSGPDPPKPKMASVSVSWNGRSYNPKTYRRCNWPGCKMCQYILNSRNWARKQMTASVEAAQAPSPRASMLRALEILNLDEDDKLLDLGCGDGRVLIEACKRYGCSGIGIEIDPEKAEQARQKASEAGLADRIVISTMDARKFNPKYHDITAGYVYLYSELLDELAPILKTLPKVVSVMHPIPEARTVQIEDVFFYRNHSP